MAISIAPPVRLGSRLAATSSTSGPDPQPATQRRFPDRRRPRHSLRQCRYCRAGLAGDHRRPQPDTGRQGRLGSVGLIDGKPATGKRGAGIVVSVGGEGDYTAFARRYLDPANRADPGQTPASQPGKAIKTYERELADWLRAFQGYDGPADQARAYFDALPPEQQRIFLRQVYYAELTQGGREYNDAAGPRPGSYARPAGHRLVVPRSRRAGRPIRYQGDITLFGGSGIQTLFGGPIHLLAPGGKMIFGVEGMAPPSTAGVVTQGAGDIQMYAKGSILLGRAGS